MSITTFESQVQPAAIAQPRPNYGMIAILLLAAVSVVVGLSYPSAGDPAIYIDHTVPQIVQINGP